MFQKYNDIFDEIQRIFGGIYLHFKLGKKCLEKEK